MRKIRRVSSVLAVALVLSACRNNPPTPALLSTPATLPDSPTATPTRSVGPTPTQAPPPVAEALLTTTPAGPLPTATPAPPTATPLPSWPERWEPAGGPFGGPIEAIAAHPSDPNTLYAAGMGGAVYKSSDGGETWVPGERVVPPSCPFADLLIDPENGDIVYAANACAGILKSSDAGAHWARASTGIEPGVTNLIGSAHAPGLLLAADHNGQAFRSRDGAVTWEPVSDGLPGEIVRGLAASAPDVYWATTANGQNGTLYRFSNGVWSAVFFGQPAETETTSVLVDPGDPAVLYVGLENLQDASADADKAFLFLSTDGGWSWSPLRITLPPAEPSGEGTEVNSSVYPLSKDARSGALYVAADGALLLSPDGGNTWHRIHSAGDVGALGNLRQITIDPTNSDVLYLPLRSAGIGKSKDGGHTWKTINRGLNNTGIGIIIAHPTDPATAYVAPDRGTRIFQSTDYGDSWTGLANGNLDDNAFTRVSELALDPSHPDTIYQVLDVTHSLRSDDGGVTWSAAWPGLRFSSIYALIAGGSGPDILYANKAGYGLYRSADGGDSWRFLPQSGVDNTYALAIHPDNADFVLSGDNGKRFETSVGLRRSKDGGDTWDVALAVPDATGITLVAFDPRVEPYFPWGKRPADPTRLYAASVGPRGTLWYSNDAGDAWKPLSEDLSFTHVKALAVARHRPGVVYAGLWGGGTWRTDDGGQSWRRLPGDPATSAAAIAVDPSNQNIVYIADGTTPHLYYSTDDGNTWELLFDAGPDYDQLAALALAPSDPSILYVSTLNRRDGSTAGSLFRVDTRAPMDSHAVDITSDLPGAPSSLAVRLHDPLRLFATVPGAGVWKTVDGGASWRQVKGDLPDVSFSQIAVDPTFPSTIFLAGDDRPYADSNHLDPDQVYGIWKSTDDGNSWARIGGTIFGRASGPIRALAFHPDDQRVMYASGEGGVYLSPDRGETWTNINGRLPFHSMNAIATDGQTLYAGSGGAGVFAGAIHPLIHTADWMDESHLTTPVARIQITLHPHDPQTLYASAYPGGVFKTTDGGASWSPRSFGLPSFAVTDPLRQGQYALAIAPNAPEVLYVGLYTQGVYRSDDGAATWHPVFPKDGQFLGAAVQALQVDPNDANIVYLAASSGETAGGVWRTVDGGQSWSEFGAGLPPGADVRTLALGASGQLFAGSHGYGVYSRRIHSEAGDDAWQQLPEMGPGASPPPSWDTSSLYQHVSLLVHPSDSSTLFSGSFPAGIFKTTDGGLVWREHNVGFEHNGVLSLISDPTDDRILYAGTTNGIARTIDGGATWHPWDVGWPAQQWVLSMDVDPTSSHVLYACSKNGGTPEDIGGTVMKSTDGGATWFQIMTGLDVAQTFRRILMDRYDPNILYLATHQEGIYISHDGGATWSSWNEGLWNRVAGGDGHLATDVLELSADGRLLYFGTAGSGVWRRPAEGAP